MIELLRQKEQKLKLNTAKSQIKSQKYILRPLEFDFRKFWGKISKFELKKSKLNRKFEK